jgi:hypothetical protein
MHNFRTLTQNCANFTLKVRRKAGKPRLKFEKKDKNTALHFTSLFFTSLLFNLFYWQV